ncbi:neuronal acetylcholine receptor subunit alpha-7-like [Haliotis rufescens]|uniref:neuronal acetylcholine receptor subunit alpha-7-like n=1 Tax=Haliotis rufescens TaxID=6454 RepID=UPI00201ED7A9|nr:neuronal acetylcholine receptor subunit alpha-7-like [Haliotis rufescens]
MHTMSTGTFVGVLAICAVAQCQLFDALYKYVIDKAANTTIPVSTLDKPVNVSIGMSLIQLTSLDSKSGYSEFEVWMSYEWTDPRLSWNGTTLNETSMIRIPASKIWNPDVTLYNGHTSSREVLAVVESTGTVMHVPPTTLKTRCDVSNYTTDGTVTCRLKFGSWTYSGLLLNPVTASWNDVDVSDYNPGGTEWDLTGHKVERNVKYYACCLGTYPDVTFFITFMKRGKSYSGWSIFY